MPVSVDQMQAAVVGLWPSGAAPVVTVPTTMVAGRELPSGSDAMLQDRATGVFVMFPLTNADLAMSIDEFAANILEPAVTALREKMST